MKNDVLLKTHGYCQVDGSGSRFAEPKDVDARFYSLRQCWSVNFGGNLAASIYSSQQALRSENDLVSRGNCQAWNKADQDFDRGTARGYFYKISFKVDLRISL